MDMRYEMRDGRRLPPRNSRGEFRRRRSRRDRGMDYGSMRGRGYARNEMADMDMRGDYRGNDMGDMARNDYGYDGHHGGMHGGRAGGYEPVEFMGYCSGYYGSPDQDYGRGGNMNYRNYDMRGGRGGRDYGYPMYDMPGGYGRDYGYDDYGDYGETLSEQELEHWNKRLMSKIEDKYKPFFTKENIVQRAKQRGYQMKDFGENELFTATLMQYTDLCKELKPFVGENLDAYIAAGYAFLVDDDTEVKGAEKLAVYFDEVVMGGEE